MSELNAEIARALGWTDIRHGLGDLQKPRDTGVPLGWTARMIVPRYDTDPAAALMLLEYVLTLREDNGRQRFEATIDQSNEGKWRIELHEWAGELNAMPYAEADTLPSAIAAACRDALVALGEATGGTETP